MAEATEILDTSDLDRFVGIPMSVHKFTEPVNVSDIRRWAQAMRHPNPLYYDAEYAAASRFGQIVAPQSFIGFNGPAAFAPAALGTIPNSHQLYGGDEWWFFGPRTVPGDTMSTVNMMRGYRVTDTNFAGPTVFQTGDSQYTNGRGEPVALQRTTTIRYLASAARAHASLSGMEETDWTDEQLAEIIAERKIYAASIHDLGHDPRSWQSVEEGDALPTKVIGPHSHVSFTTEFRAESGNVWGRPVERTDYLEIDLGLTEVMTAFTENADWDPEFGDYAYYGVARGHLFDKYARWVGMPRAYGYGATIGAWIHDYFTSWAGEWGFLAHSTAQFRTPVLVGDVTYLRATITGKSTTKNPAEGKVTSEYVMTSHRGEVLTQGIGELLLPME